MPASAGTDRAKVAGLLVASGTLAGALAGGAFGVALAAVPNMTLLWSVGAVLAAAILDVIGALAPKWWPLGPRPPAVRRQVPQTWGRVLPAPTVAVLYGAQLGVGPLTFLVTWLWWAAAIVAATHGPLVGALAGGVFGLVRLGVVAAWPEARPGLGAPSLSAEPGRRRRSAPAP